MTEPGDHPAGLSSREATARAGSFRTAFDGRRMRDCKDLPIHAAPGLHEEAPHPWKTTVGAMAIATPCLDPTRQLQERL